MPRWEGRKGAPAPSNSGKGQKIARCATCRIALWSNYAGAGEAVRFVRVGTLDEPDRLPPDIHIFTSSKQPWVVLLPGTPAVDEFYDLESYWPEAGLARRRAALALVINIEQTAVGMTPRLTVPISTCDH